jgi:hypothetical protein
MLPGQPQLHHDSDHLSLRTVVQILFDAAQPRGRVVHDKSPGPFQLTNPRAVLPSIQNQLPAWHLVGEPADQPGRHEEERSPPAPGSAEDRPQDHQPDRNERTHYRDAPDMPPPELRARPPVPDDPRDWSGRQLRGLVCSPALSRRPSGRFVHQDTSCALRRRPLRRAQLPLR